MPKTVKAVTTRAVEPRLTHDSRVGVLTRRRPLLAEAFFIIGCVITYSVICSFAPLRPQEAFDNANDILALERMLGIDYELNMNMWLNAHPHLASVASSYYTLSFFLFVAIALFLLWFKNPSRFYYARNTLFVMTFGAALTYWLFPVAPPRLLDGAAFTDSVAVTSGFGSGYMSLFSSVGNPYGAMPSMHTGWSVWVAVMLGAFVFRQWWQRLLLAIHPIATIWIIMATGNHYILDAVAGVLYFFAASIFVHFLRRDEELFSTKL